MELFRKPVSSLMLMSIFSLLFMKLAISTESNRRDNRVPKAGNMYLTWEHKEDPALHSQFEQMLRVALHIFDIVLSLIEHHPVFRNNRDSNHPQAPVEVQLAVTLYRMGHCGNGASIQDIARAAGCSKGSVENYTKG
jgi:hypothetical protein